MRFFNKKNIFLLLLGVSTLNLFFRCNNKLDCRESIYSFSIGVKAFPDKDSINLGDTLWLEINSPSTLTDVQTRRIIDYSDASNLGSVITFHKLSSINQFNIPAATNFIFMLEKGIYTNSSNLDSEREYIFAEESQRYKFRLGIIAKDTGTFRLFFSHAANVYRKNDKCTKAFFSMNFENTNQHYYLSPTYQGGTLVGGDYYFKVK